MRLLAIFILITLTLPAHAERYGIFTEKAGKKIVPNTIQQTNLLEEQKAALNNINTNLVSQTEITKKTNELLESLIGIVEAQTEQIKVLQTQQQEINKSLKEKASPYGSYNYRGDTSSGEEPIALRDETGNDKNRPKTALEKIKQIPKNQRNEELESRLAARGITMDIFKSLRQTDKLKLLEVMFRN